MQRAYEHLAIATHRPVYIRSLCRGCAKAGRRFEKDPRCYCVADANAVVLTRGVLVVSKQTADLRSADNWSSCPWQDRNVSEEA